MGVLNNCGSAQDATKIKYSPHIAAQRTERGSRMKKIKLIFPNGTEVKATLWETEEPELCESLWDFAKEEQSLICHNTLSTGFSFPAFRRPSRSPNTESHLANPIGRHKVDTPNWKRVICSGLERNCTWYMAFAQNAV